MGCVSSAHKYYDDDPNYKEGTELLHTPPDTHVKIIEDLNYLQYCHLLTIQTKHKNYISVIEFCPRYINISNKIIIFSHSNTSNIHTMFDDLRRLSDAIGIIIVCYDYPGYGLSKGKPTEKSCYDALDTVVTHYKQNYKILLIGNSFGTGVVVSYACKNEWAYPIILISPFMYIKEDNYWTGKRKIFHIKRQIGDLLCPVKIIHGSNDKVIPITHAKKLYSALSNKSISPLWLRNVGHYDILNKITSRDISEVVEYDTNIF